MPALVFARLVALMALIVLPAGAVFLANYHTFEGVHEVRGCASCHVMLPMVNDMRDPGSETLAALHYKNKWIAKDQCYHCHSDYGLGGGLEAKMTGFRHLALYTTRTYQEPIKARVKFDNNNCLNCHEGTPKFVAVETHVEVAQGTRRESDDRSRLPWRGAPDGSAANSRLERLLPTDGEDEMRLLRWEALCAIVAFALTETFILLLGRLSHGALHVHRPQPLFAIVAIGYLLKVRADLRKRGL